MNQVGALASFGMTVSAGVLKNSAIVTRIYNGEDPNKVVREELPKYPWVYPMPTKSEAPRFLEFALEQTTGRR